MKSQKKGRPPVLRSFGFIPEIHHKAKFSSTMLKRFAGKDTERMPRRRTNPAAR